MTSYREELAGRLEEHARRYERAALMAENRAKRRTDSSHAAAERSQAKLFRSRAADMKQAAAALRQSPTVEEVAGTVGLELRRQLSHSFQHMSFDGPTQEMGFSAPSRPDVSIRLQPIARRIADLYGRRG